MSLLPDLLTACLLVAQATRSPVFAASGFLAGIGTDLRRRGRTRVQRVERREDETSGSQRSARLSAQPPRGGRPRGWRTSSYCMLIKLVSGVIARPAKASLYFAKISCTSTGNTSA